LLYQNKTVSKIGTGEAKPFGKLEILETLPLNHYRYKKYLCWAMLPSVIVSNWYSDKLSQMPVTKFCNKMIGKNGIEIWKSERNR
jgi:DNA polymerase-4